MKALLFQWAIVAFAVWAGQVLAIDGMVTAVNQKTVTIRTREKAYKHRLVKAYTHDDKRSPQRSYNYFFGQSARDIFPSRFCAGTLDQPTKCEARIQKRR